MFTVVVAVPASESTTGSANTSEASTLFGCDSTCMIMNGCPAGDVIVISDPAAIVSSESE
jgi:hypothetical protein